MPAARRIIAAASTAVTVLAVAAPAHAATIQTLPCARTVDGTGNLPIAGAGFAPGSSIGISSVPEGVFASATADAAGNFALPTNGTPSFNPFARQLQTFQLVATDRANPALTASTSYQQVRVGYTTNPSSGRPTRSAVHTVRGFVPGQNIYLHFRFGGQTKRNVKLGRASAPCGIASKRMPLLPARSRPGTWIVYADQKPVFSKNTQPQLKYSLVIRRTFG
jgi:hypothetical protein